MTSPTDLPPAVLVSEADLRAAARAGLLADAQVAPLWTRLQQAGRGQGGGAAARPAADGVPARQVHESPHFGFTHLLYYFGGLLAIGAATLFLTEAFQRLGAWAVLAISLAYLGACVLASQRLQARGLGIPAGILATLAVCLVPLATWALQHGLGWWPEGGVGDTGHYRQYHSHIDWRWLTLELVTLAAAAVALWALRHPFLMMPVAITLWYTSMDLARLIVAPDGGAATWAFYRDFSMGFGGLMVLLAFWIDVRSRGPGGSGRDYPFWLYLLGMLTFWGALSARDSDRELDKLVYGLLNLGFVLLGVLLQRRVFTVLGGLGVAAYLGHLSWKVFKDSLLFPLALTVIGLGVIALGVWWQRHEARWQAVLRQRVPAAWLRWLPPG
jgi:hypothetical protein